ncbi:hypothetical protein T02_13224 [Trichinella nativa]|uniref:Uncharacterized protein n=1 Tax=Trichinella nativa TaxID=6335 RepID=A0A0V1LD89_9BILA|nr:hypothetical protein T02_13224 [Trichinella nativa]
MTTAREKLHALASAEMFIPLKTVHDEQQLVLLFGLLPICQKQAQQLGLSSLKEFSWYLILRWDGCPKLPKFGQTI